MVCTTIGISKNDEWLNERYIAKPYYCSSVHPNVSLTTIIITQDQGKSTQAIPWVLRQQWNFTKSYHDTFNEQNGLVSPISCICSHTTAGWRAVVSVGCATEQHTWAANGESILEIYHKLRIFTWTKSCSVVTVTQADNVLRFVWPRNLGKRDSMKILMEISRWLGAIVMWLVTLRCIQVQLWRFCQRERHYVAWIMISGRVTTEKLFRQPAVAGSSGSLSYSAVTYEECTWGRREVELK